MNYENDNDLFAKIKEHLYTAVVGDVMDQLGYYNQFLPANIRPLKSHMTICGRAFTVLEADTVDTNKEGGNNPYINKSFGLMLEALDSLKENDVYICSGASYNYALFGEIMSARAKYLRSSGAVLNGYIRDTTGILQLDFPVFSAGNYAQDQANRGKVIDFNVIIKFGNVIINPGDIIFGDIDGVCIIPKEIEKQVVTMAYVKATDEKTVLKEINAGMPAKDAFEKYGIM